MPSHIIVGLAITQIEKKFQACDSVAANMTNPPESPRAFPRFEVEASVDYTGTEILLNHRIQNLSLGGLCILTDALEAVGTVVDLVITFRELDTSITARGEVVWANQDEPMDMGIRFVELDTERKETLRKYLTLARDA